MCIFENNLILNSDIIHSYKWYVDIIHPSIQSTAYDNIHEYMHTSPTNVTYLQCMTDTKTMIPTFVLHAALPLHDESFSFLRAFWF